MYKRDIKYLRTTAELWDHIGILFSSVNSENKSSAEAIRSHSTAREVVFNPFWAVVLNVCAVPPEVLESGEGATGVAARLGSWELEALIVMSLPCVFMRMEGNSLNLASSCLIRFDLPNLTRVEAGSVCSLISSQPY